MTAMAQTAPGPGPRIRIVVWLLLALAALALLLGALGVLAVSGIRKSEAEVLRAEQSLTQLENIRAVEAAFDRYLLGEIIRRVEPLTGTQESRAAGELRGALLVYRRTIGAEIAAGTSDAERDEERREMIRASALSTLFETVETEAMIDRHRGGAATPIETVRGFLGRSVSGRDEAFRAVVVEVLGDERVEAAQAFARLEDLRRWLLTAGSVLGGAFLLGMAGFGYLFYRVLMRPIRQLTLAAEGLPQGLARPVPRDLPGEFALLASRFNAMAERIGTEQQRLQAEVAARTAALEAANAELTRIDRSRREFFANVSHELRTPVTVLMGEAQIALRTPGGERGALERIIESARFLSRRIGDLLSLARSQNGELTLKRAPMELGEAIRAAAETARAYGEANGVAVSFSPGKPVEIEGDREALRQAALALIDNAVKYSPEGATVTVAMTPCGFEVSDDGPGFGTADPGELFARYARGSAGGSGAGLGLAIVRWVAEEHGAAIHAGNRPEGGARIALEFGT